MDVKFRLFNKALENWQTIQISPRKKPQKSIWPEIICLCHVMTNRSMILNPEGLENST